MEKRGQISVEYLIVVGFVVFVVIGLVGIAFFYAANIENQIRFNQLEGFANKIISSAESVYFAGEPSRVTITAYLPKGVRSVNVVENGGDYFIVFMIDTSGGSSTSAFESDVPIVEGEFLSVTGTNEGLKKLVIVADPGENKVKITEG